ncbi:MULTISPECIES: superoxide dismutase family protein [Gammaproteobacteria]|uniref:superoxide dismutase family protein n=1 Tax=Gammaproteobacteria TaxID=1236 RepID=UPI000DCF66E2|nr:MULTISPECIES: superoxide dismutase family protein [Gammaproteobacteria]RTE85969.1 superoxide dismutase family protein [Aliidiomarina sp. B3213]TCZ90032.1 superoxide dismutase family protein [Lysobacter sp. N42]
MTFRILSSALLVTALSACGGAVNHPAEVVFDGPEKAVAYLAPTEGNEGLSGYVTFQKSDDGIHIMAHIEGLEPNSDHGFHVHQFGDCSAANGTSAGGHFNPEGLPHGGPGYDARHVGDLGNVTSMDSGMVHHEAVDTKLAMVGENSILGRAVVVHAGQDDMNSQPTGAAGSRLLCGVIGVAE